MTLEERLSDLARYYRELSYHWEGRPNPTTPHSKILSAMSENLQDVLDDHQAGKPLRGLVWPPKE